MRKLVSFILCLMLMLAPTTMALSGCGGKGETGATAENGLFPEIPVAKYQATHINVIDSVDATTAELTLLMTLQGLTCNLTDNQIYIRWSGGAVVDGQLSAMQSFYGVTVDYFDDPWDIIFQYSDLIDNYILCDIATPCVGIGAGLAGINSAPLVDATLAQYVEDNLGWTKLMDIRGWTDESLTKEDIAVLGFSKDIVGEFSYEKPYMFDYATMAGAYVIWQITDSTTEGFPEKDKRLQILNKLDLNPNAVIMGYGDYSTEAKEEYFMRQSCSMGFEYSCLDLQNNGSVLSGFNHVAQENWMLHPEGERIVENPDVNKHYVAFYISDGDNMSYDAQLAWSSNWFTNSIKSKVQFPVTYSTSPGYPYTGGPSLDYLYSNATSLDAFAPMLVSLTQSSTIGVQEQANRLRKGMQILDANVALFNQGGDDFVTKPKEWYDHFTAIPELDAIFSYTFWGGNFYGLTVWSNDKPVIGMDYGLEPSNREQKIREINQRAAKYDATTAFGYDVVYVNTWTNTLNDLQYIVNNLASNCEVVNLSQIAYLYQYFSVGKE